MSKDNILPDVTSKNARHGNEFIHEFASQAE